MRSSLCSPVHAGPCVSDFRVWPRSRQDEQPQPGDVAGASTRIGGQLWSRPGSLSTGGAGPGAGPVWLARRRRRTCGGRPRSWMACWRRSMPPWLLRRLCCNDSTRSPAREPQVGKLVHFPRRASAWASLAAAAALLLGVVTGSQQDDDSVDTTGDDVAQMDKARMLSRSRSSPHWPWAASWLRTSDNSKERRSESTH